MRSDDSQGKVSYICLLMKKSVAFKLLLTFLVLVVIAGILEGGSYFILRFRNLSVSEDYERVYNQAAEGNTSWQKENKPHNLAEHYKLHPYFGHTYNFKGNNYRFLSSLDYPYKAGPNDFVIGVFGGSTAMHWLQFLEKSKRWEKTVIAHRPNARIVLLNMALAEYRQPQQLNVASKFIDTLNLALVLDGWNDSILDMCQNNQPELPQIYNFLFDNESRRENLAELKKFSKRFRLYSAWLEKSIFVRSYFAHLVWTIYQSHLRNEQSRLTIPLYSESNQKSSFANECGQSHNERMYSIWKKYSSQMWNLAHFQHVPLVHFLQPNPFLKNAKPLGDEEKRIVQWDEQNDSMAESAGYNAGVFRSYYLKDHFKNSTDLSFIFSTESRITYIDPYTHMNELGYQILSDTVSNDLKRRGLFQ